jgi:uncharacterized membrane protein YuzA (DUF378 family)
MKLLHIIVYTLLVIGGINWGLIGFFDYNLVAAIFGPLSATTQVIYAVVGISALLSLLLKGTYIKCDTYNPKVVLGE